MAGPHPRTHIDHSIATQTGRAPDEQESEIENVCGWTSSGDVVRGWLGARASERCGIGGHRAAGAPLDTLEMLLPSLALSLPNFPLPPHPRSISAFSAAAPFDCLSFSLFSLRSLYSLPRSPARSRSAKVDPLEQLDPGKRAADTAWSNRCCLVANETPQNPRLSRCETDMDLIPPKKQSISCFRYIF